MLVMLHQRILLLSGVVCLALGLALLSGGPLVGSAIAQDDSPPPLPASYHGNLTISDGEIDQQVQIEAVADGEVQDTITTDQDGSIGGPTVSDDKLEVQQPEDETVEFHIDGEPAKIVGGDVQTAENRNDAIVWESGDQSIQLETTAEATQPSLGITISNTTSPIEEGETIEVTASVTNNGPVRTTQQIELRDFNNNTVDSESESLPIGETSSITLQWATDQDEVVNDTTDLITVQVKNSSDSSEIEIRRNNIPEVAPEPQPDEGLGGSGSSGGGSDTDENNTTPGTGQDNLLTEQHKIVSDSDLRISQVRFSSRVTVTSITWFDTLLNGSVSVRSSNVSDANADTLPGTLLNLSNVTAPSQVAAESGIIQFRVSSDRLSQLGIDADNLRVYVLENGGWRPLSTEVNRATEQNTLIETETGIYSMFGITAVSKPEAAVTAPEELTAGDVGTFAATSSSDRLGEINSFKWTIGGEEYTGETVTASFDDPGQIDGELTVKNAAGETATTNFSLTIRANESSSPDATQTESESMPGFTATVAIISLVVGLIIARVASDPD